MNNWFKQTVLCIGLVAYVATVVSGSVDAVICYGSDSPVEEEGIKSHCCDHKNITKSVTIVSISGGYDNSSSQDHNYCCTDIPVSTGKTEKYITKIDKKASSGLLATNHLTISLPPESHQIEHRLFSPLPFSNDKSLDTVILLI